MKSVTLADGAVTGGTLLSSENYLYDGSDRLIRVVETDGNNVVKHDFSWTYDAKDNVTALTESIGGKSFSYTYAYDDDSRPTTFGYGDVTKQITYDGHGRSSGTTVKNGSRTVLGTGYAYRDVDSTYTTTQVKSVTNSYGGKTANFNYTYDANGNILSVSGDQTVTYEYDDLGQLITETIGTGDDQVIIRYTYDNGGNLIKKVREYTTDVPEPTPTSDNLLSDGGFEVASSWKAVYKNSVSASTQTTNGRSGSCWMLDYYAGDPAKVYTTVNVTPGESYTLSGYVVGSAKLYISAGDETVFSSAGGSSWQLCSVDITIPDGITTAQVGGYLDYDDPSRLDDLCFAISTPSSTTGTSDASNGETLYTYGDAEWGDLLTAYNGEVISYDGIGNPLSYRGWTMSWQGGRQLASMTKGSDTLSFAYNESGLRTSKTVNGVTHSYVWQGSKLAADITDAYALYFHYDSTGDVIGFTRTANGTDTEYFYVKNLQGDILKVISATGTEAAAYSYDAWGKLLTSAGDLAEVNPLRYRGYFYDTETGLYYLKSRYYDPEVSRFINPDAFVSSGTSVASYNMMVYCDNNPINRIDPAGMFWREIGDFFSKTWNGLKTWARSAFGAESSTIATISEIEIPIIPDPSPVTIKTGTKTTQTISKYGDSSKFISVYANKNVTHPARSSSAGININIVDFTANLSLGLDDTGISISASRGNTTSSFGIKLDLSEFKIGFEYSSAVQWDNITETAYTNVSASGWAFVAVYLLTTTGQYVPSPSYA